MKANIRIAITYYSRTGTTEFIVNTLRQRLIETGSTVDTYRVLPANDYSKPLHLNLRLLYDTLVRRGTDLRFIPKEPKLEDYDAVVIASPIWCYTLAPPIQEFLKRYCSVMKNLIVITTSIMDIRCSRIKKIVKGLCKAKLVSCTNISKNIIKDGKALEAVIQDVVNVIINLHEHISPEGMKNGE